VAPFFRTRCSVLALSVEGTSYDKNTTSHLVIENEFQMSYAEVYWIMFSPFQRPNQLGVCSVRGNFSNNVSHKHRPSNNSTLDIPHNMNVCTAPWSTESNNSVERVTLLHQSCRPHASCASLNTQYQLLG